MRLLKVTGFACALLASRAYGEGIWAHFCDDTACAVNCGEDVNVLDPGCLSEVGRNSIFFHDFGKQNDVNFCGNVLILLPIAFRWGRRAGLLPEMVPRQ